MSEDKVIFLSRKERAESLLNGLQKKGYNIVSSDLDEGTIVISIPDEIKQIEDERTKNLKLYRLITTAYDESILEKYGKQVHREISVTITANPDTIQIVVL